MNADFSTMRSQGGLIPSDLLQRIVANDHELGGLAPQDYGLTANDQLREAAARAWSKAKAYWAAFRAATQDLPASESGVTQTREQWLLPLLHDLGYRDLEFRPAAKVIGDRRYPISHRTGPVPLHLVSYRQSLDRATPAAGQVRSSPHAMLQEYLNVSDAVYGMVSNGYVLRLLRDNASLTRQAYLEFNLEAMLEGGVYADFVLFYLALHRSRLPQTGTEPSQCWLEKWRAKAESQGTRALGELRRGVEAAIIALGTGFLAHPANEALRKRLVSENLTVPDYYQQLLRLVYRLIFLFVAEERDLIFPAGADPADKRRYAEHYAASRLRRILRKYRTDDRHDDLWLALRITFQLLGGERQGLGLPALGGGLFDPESCPDLDGALLRNDALAEAIRRLSWVRIGRVTRWVKYQDMDTEELGGVYEGLLERQPQVLADTMHPRFELVGSGQRKQTGSYYTPETLVQELVRTALEPVIADRMKDARTPEQRRHALLNITICDPACGSGHFLLAAARKIADRLARSEAGGNEPSPEQLRDALRQVIRHCLYGVDVNPLAVDLCKLALWLEGHDPGHALTFLDHRIKLGNSLIGATPELVTGGIPEDAFEPVVGDNKILARAIKRRNREELRQLAFTAVDADTWTDLRESLGIEVLEIADLPEDGLPQLAEQKERYQAFRQERLEPALVPLDAWTAAFFWPLTPDAPEPPTNATLFSMRRKQQLVLSPRQQEEVARLRHQHRFFHWPLEFSEVFADGGFDCVLGNPPWDKLEMDEQEFFAECDPEIAALHGTRRKQAISVLEHSNSLLWSDFHGQARRVASTTKFVKDSGRFGLTGSGRINLYALFAEHDRALLNHTGWAGIVVPTGIATDDQLKEFFQDVIQRRSLVQLTGFENEDFVFPDVANVVRFCLFVVSGEKVVHTEHRFAFYLRGPHQLTQSERFFALTQEDIELLNPNTGTCPIFRTQFDADLTKAIYRRVPVLVNHRTGTNQWGVEFMQGLFNMASDSGRFKNHPAENLLPLYEAKLFWHFDHRFGSYDLKGVMAGKGGRGLPDMPLKWHADPTYVITPQYWVDRDEVEARIPLTWQQSWFVVFRDVTSAKLERTAVFSYVPRVAVGHKAPIVFFPSSITPSYIACFVANCNSLAFDYVVRQKIGGTSLGFFIMKQLPVLATLDYHSEDIEFISRRVLELTYTAWDLRPLANDLGYEGSPFGWDEERRSVLRAELDAFYAALYGLTCDELRYILDPSAVHGSDFPGETFRVLKERELREYGEYRTGRLVLEAWDRLGLEPRNRDGRNTVGPPPSSANGSPEPFGLLESSGKYQVGPRRSKVVVSAGRPISSRRTRATRSAANATGPLWDKMQPSLPGMPSPVQPSFGDMYGDHDVGSPGDGS